MRGGSGTVSRAAPEQVLPPVRRPSPRSPDNLPGKALGSVWGLMKLPKSSENMLKAFSMGGSWAGRAREAEEDEEEWKLLSSLKVEAVLWLIHGGRPGPGQAGRGTGEGVGSGGACRAPIAGAL